MYPSFENLSGTQRIDFQSGLVPPIVPQPDMNQAETITCSGQSSVQDIGPFYFNVYTLNWDLLRYNDFLLLQDWYNNIAGGKKTEFIYYTPYGTSAIVKFVSYGPFREISSECLSGTVILREIKQR